MHQKWCPFPPFVGLATNMSFTLVTKFLFKKVWATGKPGIFNFYCVLAINYLLSTIKVNKLFYLNKQIVLFGVTVSHFSI